MKLPPILSCKTGTALAVSATMLLAGNAVAADVGAGLTMADLNFAPMSVEESIQLAQNDAVSASDASYDDMVSKDKPFLTGKSLHQYLGLGSLALALAAAATAPDSEGGVQVSTSRYNTHKALGTAAAALGGMAIVNGFYVNGDDFNIDNGWTDPDNLHILLGIAGTLGYLAAVATKGKGGHAAAGAGGAALMGLGIALEW